MKNTQLNIDIYLLRSSYAGRHGRQHRELIAAYRTTIK